MPVDDDVPLVVLAVPELDEFEDEDPAFELELEPVEVEPEEELPELDAGVLLDVFLEV